MRLEEQRQQVEKGRVDKQHEQARCQPAVSCKCRSFVPWRAAWPAEPHHTRLSPVVNGAVQLVHAVRSGANCRIAFHKGLAAAVSCHRGVLS